MQFSGLQQEIEFQLSVRTPDSIQNTQKRPSREGLCVDYDNVSMLVCCVARLLSSRHTKGTEQSIFG